jgi:hypothetical protein
MIKINLQNLRANRYLNIAMLNQIFLKTQNQHKLKVVSTEINLSKTRIILLLRGWKESKRLQINKIINRELLSKQ